MHKISILVADDDVSINALVRDCLECEGWKIISAISGTEAIKIADEKPLDLAILDLKMPDISGCEICRYIAANYSIPIIMLSAVDNPDDKVTCLNSGADDYITKPFVAGELIPRVKAVLRRYSPEKYRVKTVSFNNGDFYIDFSTRTVQLTGREIALTQIEYRLLQELVFHSGQILTYQHLLNRVWGIEYRGEKEYLHVYVGHLRSKIEPGLITPTYIITVPGVGYRFQATSDY